MTKPKTLDQLRAEKERAETQLAQEQHKLNRLENRKKYLEKGERQKRTHRLCNLGGTIESLAPEVKDLTRTEMTELIHYLGQYLSTKSIYGEFLKAPNKKIFRQAHSDELAQYEEALQILKQHSPDGKFPTMKDLRAEKEQLTIQKDAQYDTYHYFKDYHKELQTVCANVDSILGAEQKVQQHKQQHTRKYEPSL